MKLTPFKQEYPHTCLPACLRMVLSHLGREHTEAELARVCGSIPFAGTSPEAAIEGLEQLGYRALWFENATLERLTSLLEQNWPVIIFLRATDLPHGQSGLHALVLQEIERGQVITLDPALGKEFRMKLNTFLSIWAKLGNQGMVVWLA